MSTRFRAFVATMASVGALVSATAVAQAATRSSPPRLTEAHLVAIALTAARAESDASPTLIQHAAGTEQTAERIAQHHVIHSRTRVDLVAMRGRFHLHFIHTPPGIPTGPGPVVITYSVLMVVVNADTGRVISSTMSQSYPQLARLGSVITDRS